MSVDDDESYCRRCGDDQVTCAGCAEAELARYRAFVRRIAEDRCHAAYCALTAPLGEAPPAGAACDCYVAEAAALLVADGGTNG